MNNQPDIITRVLAIAAIAISFLTLLLTYFRDRRDREKLITRSFFYKGGEGYPMSMKVEAVNGGRRHIILTAIGFTYADGSWKTLYIDHDKGGSRLEEKEHHTVDYEDLHMMLFDTENSTHAVNMWFQDSLGRKIPVKGAKGVLKNYFSAKKPSN